MTDTTTASLRRDEFWQPRLDMTLTGPSTADQSHWFGIAPDDALDWLRNSDHTTATITITTSAARMERVLAALGASDE